MCTPQPAPAWVHGAEVHARVHVVPAEDTLMHPLCNEPHPMIGSLERRGRSAPVRPYAACSTRSPSQPRRHTGSQGSGAFGQADAVRLGSSAMLTLALAALIEAR